MQFRILGPLEVAEQEVTRPLGGAKQRAVLAILLLHRGEVLSGERLIEELWGEHAPATAAKVLQSYISRPWECPAYPGRGYVLSPAAGEVDLESSSGLRRGRAGLAGGDAASAAARLRRRSACGAARRSDSPMRRSPVRSPPGGGARGGAGGRIERSRWGAMTAGAGAGVWRASIPAGAPVRPADARAVPRWPPGRGAAGLSRLAADLIVSWASNRAASCASCIRQSSSKTSGWTCRARPRSWLSGRLGVRRRSSGGSESSQSWPVRSTTRSAGRAGSSC